MRDSDGKNAGRAEGLRARAAQPLEAARAVLAAVDAVHGLASRLSAGEHAVLRTGTTESAADRLGELITRLRLRHPEKCSARTRRGVRRWVHG